MAQVHDRMPVILPRDLFSDWLDCDEVKPADAAEMMQPAANETLELIPISTAVNKVGSDDSSVQAPLGDPIRWPA